MRSALLAAAVLVPAITQAAVFTDESTFLSQMPSVYYQEDFNYTIDQQPPSFALTADFGPKNGYAFRATAPGPSGTNYLYTNPGALSIEDARDFLLIAFTGDPVRWVGGQFYPSTDPGTIASGAQVTVTFSTGDSFQLTGEGFLGISSDTPIQWMIVNAPDIAPGDPYAGTYYWPAVDRLYVGGADPVPEPTILGILPLVGLALSRRR